MEKVCVIFLTALVLAHAAARNIPNDDQTKPSTTAKALAPVENTQNVVTTAGAPGAVDDQKNFIAYGGVGGWAGVGGFAGVIPVIPILGGVGVPSGLGGLGGLGGSGGPGGLGGLGSSGSARGGATGKTVP